jgi:hypothetical protein
MGTTDGVRLAGFFVCPTEPPDLFLPKQFPAPLHWMSYNVPLPRRLGLPLKDPVQVVFPADSGRSFEWSGRNLCGVRLMQSPY